MRTFLAFAIVLVASPALAQKEFGFDNRKGSGQPYLKPEETVAKFKVADEFEVKLFAGEPQVVNPVAFTIDEKGRVWVVECFEYPKRTPKGKQPRDRIVILEDTDGDGACDRRTVFAEGKDFPVPEERKKAGLGAFDLCTGIEVGHGGVFVGAAPYLWFIENKDDKPGKFEVLLRGFGSEDTHETLNTFQWGPDGWLYGLHGVFTQSNVYNANEARGEPVGPPVQMNGAVWRYHPKQKKFEIFAEGTSNPWGMDWRNTDGQFILACCVIPHLYHIVPGGIYKRQAGASYNPHVYSYLNEICDHTFHKESGWAHAGLISLDVPHMPVRFRNSVIFGSIHGCSIKENILKPNGSTYTASRGDDFLASSDKNFRPINMKWGPAGDIYLIDWHDQNPCHQTAPDLWDYERGRVYRVQLKGMKARKGEDLGSLTVAELKPLLKDPNPYRRRTALRIIQEGNRPIEKRKPGEIRGDGFEAFPYLAGEMGESLSGDMWGLWRMFPSGHEVFALLLSVAGKEKDLGKLLGEIPVSNQFAGDTAARAWAVRWVGEVPTKQDSLAPALATLAKTEAHATVRRELASATIKLADKHDVTPLLRALMSRKEDAKDPVIPQLVWIAYEKILANPGRKSGGVPKNPAPDGDGSPADKELAWLAEQSPDNPFVRDQIVPKVMRRLVATGKSSDLKRCVEFVAKLKDAASREKALEGLSVALAGQAVNAPEGWAALQAEIAKGNDSKLVALANKLAVNFRDPVAIKRLIEVARGVTATGAHTDYPGEARVNAVRQIGVLKLPDGTKILLDLLANDPDTQVQSEAVRSLAAFDDRNIPTALLAKWKDLSKDQRPDVVNTLGTRKEWAKALLRAMADKMVDRTEVTDNTILRFQAFRDKELDGLIEKAWGRTRQTPVELAKVIDRARASLHEAPASFERGRKVFETNCAKCHKFEGKGAEVGPALDGAGRDIEYILGNVLDPNRVIGAPYFVRTARLLDDTVFQGVLAEEDEQSITLKIENAVLKKIKKADLNGPVIVSEKSLMPEGLGYNMTPQDFRDLVRYLMAHPFVTDVTANGTKLAVGAPGLIKLPDTKGAPVVVEAEITGTYRYVMKTKLLIGSSADYEVRWNGKAIGSGKGTGNQLRPDQESLDITIPEGKNTLTIVFKNTGAGQGLYVRLLDPDRKLRYPDAEK